MKCIRVLCLLILTCLLFGCLCSCQSPAPGFLYYENEAAYTAGECVDVENVTELELYWLSGNVTVERANDDVLRIREECDEVLPAEDQMQWTVKDGKLIVRFCSSRSSSVHLPEKDLIVSIPESLFDCLDEIRIDTVSANVAVSNVRADTITVDSASGGGVFCDVTASVIELVTASGSFVAQRLIAQNLEFRGVSGGLTCIETDLTELKVENTSGKIVYDGKLDRIDAETISASVHLSLSETPNTIDVDTVSGNLFVNIPEDSSFVARFESTSGNFHSGFTTTQTGKRYTHGTGGADIRMQSTSGSLSIDTLP